MWEDVVRGFPSNTQVVSNNFVYFLLIQALRTGQKVDASLMPFIYGTHYSSAAAVLHYLQR